MRNFIIFIIATQIPIASAKDTPVSVAFIEALSAKDTTYSERFKGEFERAIALGKGLVENDLKKCGFNLRTSTEFFEASDPLQAQERAEKAEKDGVWMIVGPARSNHYLLSVKGAPTTPSISTMASSDELMKLNRRHTSLSPSNSAMAKAAVKEALGRLPSKKTKKYITIVASDCIACVDFAKAFYKNAKVSGLKEVTRIEVSGDYPEIAGIQSQVPNEKFDFILLPNYSKLSGHIMANLQQASVFYVGGDGWGDSKFGFIQNNKGLEESVGFTVRGFPIGEKGLTPFRLGREILQQDPDLKKFPGNATAIAIYRTFDGLKDILCTSKPNSKASFQNAFAKGKTHFSAPWGVSIFNLSHGNLSYAKSSRVNNEVAQK